MSNLQPYNINDINYLLPANKGLGKKKNRSGCGLTLPNSKYKTPEDYFKSNTLDMGPTKVAAPVPIEIKNDPVKKTLWEKMKSYDYNKLLKISLGVGAAALVAGLIIHKLYKNQQQQELNVAINNFNDAFQNYQLEEHGYDPEELLQPRRGRRMGGSLGLQGVRSDKGFTRVGQKPMGTYEKQVEYNSFGNFPPIDPRLVHINIVNPTPAEEKKNEGLLSKIKKLPWKKILGVAAGIGAMALLARRYLMSSGGPVGADIELGEPEEAPPSQYDDPRFRPSAPISLELTDEERKAYPHLYPNQEEPVTQEEEEEIKASIERMFGHHNRPIVPTNRASQRNIFDLDNKLNEIEARLRRPRPNSGLSGREKAVEFDDEQINQLLRTGKIPKAERSYTHDPNLKMARIISAPKSKFTKSRYSNEELENDPNIYIGEDGLPFDIRDFPEYQGFGLNSKRVLTQEGKKKKNKRKIVGSGIKDIFDKLKNLNPSTLKKIAAGVGTAALIAATLLSKDNKAPHGVPLFEGFD